MSKKWLAPVMTQREDVINPIGDEQVMLSAPGNLASNPCRVRNQDERLLHQKRPVADKKPLRMMAGHVSLGSKVARWAIIQQRGWCANGPDRVQTMLCQGMAFRQIALISARNWCQPPSDDEGSHRSEGTEFDDGKDASRKRERDPPIKGYHREIQRAQRPHADLWGKH